MMQGYWDNTFKEEMAKYVAKRLGLTLKKRTTLGEADPEDLQRQMAHLPAGRPIIIQDFNGNTTYLPGMDGPL